MPSDSLDDKNMLNSFLTFTLFCLLTILFSELNIRINSVYITVLLALALVGFAVSGGILQVFYIKVYWLKGYHPKDID